MNFFAVFLRKLEPSCKIGAYSAAIFRKVPYGKSATAGTFFVTVSCVIRDYHVYKEVRNPQYWRRGRVLHRGREFTSQESCNLNVRRHLLA